MKSEPIGRKLDNIISESGLTSTLMVEGRGHQPALILMKRGTLIPVHHFRKYPAPTSGEIWVIAGIDPARYEVTVTGGYPGTLSDKAPFTHRMRDFYAPGKWVPSIRMMEEGWQDETGWSEPNADGHYDATRDFAYIRKFRKVLTMKESNIRTIELLDRGTDPKAYEPKPYDDNATWYRKQRIRGTRLDGYQS